MSSFGGIPLIIDDIGIDYLISCEYVLGSTRICICYMSQKKFEKTRGTPVPERTMMWETMETKGGKWRYTSPTHTLLAFHQALEELENEGVWGSKQAILSLPEDPS